MFFNLGIKGTFLTLGLPVASRIVLALLLGLPLTVVALTLMGPLDQFELMGEIANESSLNSLETVQAINTLSSSPYLGSITELPFLGELTDVP